MTHKIHTFKFEGRVAKISDIQRPWGIMSSRLYNQYCWNFDHVTEPLKLPAGDMEDLHIGLFLTDLDFLQYVF